MLTASVPWSSCTSTVSRRGVFDTSSIFFLMNSVSVAFWKYLDLVILSTKRMILLGLWPPAQLYSIKAELQPWNLMIHVSFIKKWRVTSFNIEFLAMSKPSVSFVTFSINDYFRSFKKKKTFHNSVMMEIVWAQIMYIMSFSPLSSNTVIWELWGVFFIRWACTGWLFITIS